MMDGDILGDELFEGLGNKAAPEEIQDSIRGWMRTFGGIIVEHIRKYGEVHTTGSETAQSGKVS